MAWSYNDWYDLSQNPLSLRWILRFSITNGSEVRTESLKFVNEPTQQEGQAAVQAYIQARNEAERIAAKNNDPPDIGLELTSQQINTLKNSVLILEGVAEVYDPEVRAEFARFVELYKRGLIKYLKS